MSMPAEDKHPIRNGRTYRVFAIALILATLLAARTEIQGSTSVGHDVVAVGLLGFGALAAAIYGWWAEYGQASSERQAVGGVLLLMVALPIQWLTDGLLAGNGAVLYMAGALALAFWESQRYLPQFPNTRPARKQ